MIGRRPDSVVPRGGRSRGRGRQGRIVDARLEDGLVQRRFVGHDADRVGAVEFLLDLRPVNCVVHRTCYRVVIIIIIVIIVIIIIVIIVIIVIIIIIIIVIVIVIIIIIVIVIVIIIIIIIVIVIIIVTATFVEL